MSDSLAWELKLPPEVLGTLMPLVEQAMKGTAHVFDHKQEKQSWLCGESKNYSWYRGVSGRYISIPVSNSES